MPQPRISASSYSNTAPLIWSFLYGSQHGKYELLLDNAPARSAELLARKTVDAALVPVIEYQRIEDVMLVPDVCVGAREKVRSVCLVTKGEQLSDVKTVALDVSSKTSVALTKIIFRQFMNFEPQYKTAKPNLNEMLKNADCALLIGDPALLITDVNELEPAASACGFSARENVPQLNTDEHGLEDKDQKSKTIDQINKGQIRKFDLAEVWKSFTGFGFVFAMWMANAEKAEIAGKIDFAAARDEGLNHIEEIIANYKTEIALERKDFRNYLTENVSYSIDEEMRKGLALFFELAHKSGLSEKNKPLSFIK